MDKQRKEMLSKVLDELEVKESKLLSWGVTGGGFSREEIETILEDWIVRNKVDEHTTAHDILEELERQKLLFRFPLLEDGQVVYRTRSAETIRLLDNLKQIMHYHKPPDLPLRWRQASDLVADYRYHIRPRKFPIRDITFDKLKVRLEALPNWDVENTTVLEFLLRRGDSHIELADFQVEAIESMFGGIYSASGSGMIITAGTGSGKTNGFYLPALAHIARVMNSVRSVKALALYPRNELLKDQFSNAYSLLLKISEHIRNHKGRPMSLGAILTGVYTNHVYLLEDLNKQKLSRWTCPYLRCPSCNGPLYWNKEDVANDRHVLNCGKSECGHKTPNDDLLCLTRNRIIAQAPDLLFTTTESLNRAMSNSWNFGIIGLSSPSTIDLVLLDEVHTYTGIHGAQVANLLRRWKNAVKRPVFFTGLSATLENATQFFSDLTGVKLTHVVQLEPKRMREFGVEYLLALRGDPVSGASLLSTTIQTLMLMRRVLDKRNNSVGFFGSKVFAFADNLDVTNRLYHNLMDAEGAVPGSRFPLASYRSPKREDELERFFNGQSWRLVGEIGHSLDKPLLLGRTSSQDSGVNTSADIVVATASLEVGYDDNQVGVVVQHKSPNDLASFLQRKGRAGRSFLMRPWTIVVLSDYGRDRVAYQSYEQLFSPVLPERYLPIKNPYVLRMQAAWVLMDWIAQKLSFVDLWKDLTPKGRSENKSRVLDLVNDLLQLDNKYLAFKSYLASVLNLEEEEIYTILWEEPRPLMTGVLPTLHRRLITDWRYYPDKVEDSSYPLPEFIPSSLFSDLNIPEVELQVPNWTESPPTMSVEQTLREFAPGRVSRRYGVANAAQSHWIPVTLNDTDEAVRLNAISDYLEEVGEYEFINEEGNKDNIVCYRPYRLNLQMVPNEVKPTSNAFLEWRTFIALPGGAKNNFSNTPQKINWTKILPQIGFFTHQNGKPVDIIRLAIGAKTNLSLNRRDNAEISKQIRFATEETKRGALGFTLAVDAVCFLVNIPKDLSSRVFTNQELIHGLRVAYYRYSLKNSPQLKTLANDFQIDWLAQGFLAALVRGGEFTGSLEYAALQIEENLREEIKEVFKVIFEVGNNNEEEGKRNHERLLALLDNTMVVQILREKAPCLWESPDAYFDEWVQKCFLSSIGSMLLDTIYQLMPNFSTSEVVLDIETPGSVIISDLEVDCNARVWISEKALGGGGVIENLARQYETDPKLFFDLFESALSASDFELVDMQMRKVLDLIKKQDFSLQHTLQQIRSAATHHEREVAHTALHEAFQKMGILPINAFYSALNVRLLKPGSSSASDELISYLCERWLALEKVLGIEVDTRLYAYLASQDPQVVAKVREIVPTDNIFSVVYSLLWPKGHTLRANVSKIFSQYQVFEASDRLILGLYQQSCEINISTEDWLAQVQKALFDVGDVWLVATRVEEKVLKVAIHQVLGKTLEVGVLFLYPQISGVAYDEKNIKVHFILPENVY